MQFGTTPYPPSSRGSAQVDRASLFRTGFFHTARGTGVLAHGQSVDTKYVAFCDNDLDYWPRWLDALVENAEANGSAAAPLIFVGPSDPPKIHHAGGSFVLRKDKAGHRLLFELHHYDNVRLPDVEAMSSERHLSITRILNIIAVERTSGKN